MFDQFFVDYPELKDELEKIKVDAFNSGKESVEKCIATVLPILESSNYPDSVKSVAIKVLKGEVSADTLQGAIIVYDAMKAKENVESAQKKSKEIGETAGSLDHETTSEKGLINNVTSFDDEVKRLKGVR